MLTVNLKKIPPELKARPQWVCWRPDKTPVDPKTGENAKANDPATWGEYEQAVKHYQAHLGNGVAGLGFEFSQADPYAGLDLDECRDPKTGELRYCAGVLLDFLASYSEVSPSKTGAHAIVNAKWPQGAGNKKTLPCGMKVEVYDRLRYFTMTGHHLEGTPTTIEDRQAELTALHTEMFGQEKKAVQASAGSNHTLNLSDQELIDTAHRAVNGEKFGKLWRGDISEYGDDDSAADFALCLMLAFWTGRDAEWMDRLFRRSGLMRDKWDRPTRGSTYGAITIDKAIANTTEVYSPGQQSLTPESSGDSKWDDQYAGPTSTGLPTWPKEVMVGAAGTFAHTLIDYLETPAPFLFMNYLVLLGHLVSDRLTLESELAPQPRLYVVCLGESADVRKSTAINKVTELFSQTIGADDLNLVYGVGSAEGLARCFDNKDRAILVLDELKALVQKMRIDGSVLLPCINTLFESNLFHSVTKKHEISIDQAHLSLLAASTLDTYQTMFTSQFLDIGFINRLWLVLGDSQRKFAVPQPLPEHEKDAIQDDLREVLRFVDDLARDGLYALPFSKEGLDIFEDWYFSHEPSVFAKRLDTFGHRLMVLLAANEMKTSITPEIAKRTVALLNYQLAARQFADPIDADNAIARVEERIRRLLASGPMIKRDLERRVNKARVGTWVWEKALQNLRREIRYDHKRKTYSLVKDRG
jgi:hypothetical protein